MERIAIHSSKTGLVVERERTSEEQALVDQERTNMPAPQPNELDLLKQRIAALEEKTKLL